MADRIYVIKIDSDLDLRLSELKKQLNEGEEIVSTVPAGDNLVITTKESKKTGKRLLLEGTE